MFCYTTQDEVLSFQFENFKNLMIFSKILTKWRLFTIEKHKFSKKNPNFWFKRLEKSIPQKPLTQNVG
jgi:hypothetical protein